MKKSLGVQIKIYNKKYCKMNKNIKSIDPKELDKLYSMVGDEIDKMCRIIQEKSGYYATGLFSLLGDEPSKCIEVDMSICMLESPHGIDEFKVRHYTKNNPNNVLNKPILAHQNSSWYMIFDGVHRMESNRIKGKHNLKANIIVPCPKDVNTQPNNI